jgi:hypothetical protein
VQIPYLTIVVLSVFAVLFYRVGSQERSWGILWAALSIIASIVALEFLTFGFVGVFLAQVALFVFITVYRVLKK